MSLVTLPRSGMPVVGNATMSREWYRWAHDITERVGGTTGASTGELTASQYEDAGIEEMRHGMFRLADEIAQAPPTAEVQAQEAAEPGIEELRAQVAELTKAVQALQQGLTA